MKKEKVAVKVTAKNVEKLRKVFAMFPDEKMDSDIIGSFPFIIRVDSHWVGVNGFYGIQVVSQKQLRAILAKEYLKAGDLVILTTGSTARVVDVNDNGIKVEDNDGNTIRFDYSKFKRYAAQEELPTQPFALLKEAFKQGAKIEYKSGGTWKLASTPSWNPNYDYRLAEVDHVGKWCKFWHDNAEYKTIRKYGKTGGKLTYPHKDSSGYMWQNYSLLPEPLQTLLNEL